jgi:hypothetical protein
MRILPIIAVSVFALAAPMGAAAAQPGPVGAACQKDIARFCAGMVHNGAVRTCLEKNYHKVSRACRRALDTTGGGRRR